MQQYNNLLNGNLVIAPEWLELPPPDPAPYTCTSLQFGAGKVAAAYCGLKEIPVKIRGHWQHGWQSSHLQVDPRLIASEIVADPTREPVWVARNDEEEFLKRCGYRHARAIGLPIAYLPERSFHRRQGSLLVMPAHSLDYTRHSWRFDEYVKAIKSIRSEFSDIVVCVHPSCVKNGYWVKEFASRGFTVIAGANANDRNALERVRALMCQFEFVTSNAYGSLLPYAAAFGAKVSLFGPLCESHMEDYEATSFYQEHPGLLEKILPFFREEILRKNFPFLFCTPQAATLRVDWGRLQIGRQNRLTPKEMKRAFGWTRYEPYRGAIISTGRAALSKTLPQKCKQVVKEIRNPKLKARNTEIARLLDLPALQPGSTDLDGTRFYFNDARTFYGSYRRIFEQHCYNFPCIKSSPTIIDCGANIGLAVRYWMQQFPSPKILAFEPDPVLFALLQKNLASSSGSRIYLHNAAVCSESGKLIFQSTGLETGHLVADKGDVQGDPVEVRAVRLSTFLDEEVDFLKVDIEGAEVDVILESAAKLANVRNICVEYHSFLGQTQRLHEVLATLSGAGFRYHVVPELFSERPLHELKANYGMDQRLNIWGYRGIRFPRTQECNS